VGQNFRPVERDQPFLMPVSLRDWLPADHLAWFVLDAVEQFDLEAFRARYRSDGRGGAAYDPTMMAGLLLYAYAVGERSSRRIEERCRTDVAFRVLSANQTPDHATLARFRAEHESALRGLFGEVLRLCAAAGLGRLGLVALDGTRIPARVSADANRGADALDAEIARMLAEAARVDAAEDAEHGPDRRGDELPAGLVDRGARLARLVEARRQLAEVDAAREAVVESRLAERAAQEARTGQRPAGRPPRADAVRRRSWDRRNTTDPESRKMRAAHGWIVGYNAQAVVAEDGIVLAAAVTQDANDVDQLAPMLAATAASLARAGVRERPGTLLADAGYWSEANAALESPDGPRLLIAPNPGRPRRPDSRRPRPRHRERMLRRLAQPGPRALYARRPVIVEPLFAHAKEVLGFRRFARRGLAAADGEWVLLCTASNLLKLWRHGRPRHPEGPDPARPPRAHRHRSAGRGCPAATPHRLVARCWRQDVGSPSQRPCPS
jgi:transposase